MLVLYFKNENASIWGQVFSLQVILAKNVTGKKHKMSIARPGGKK